jgi:hypothetical protein
MSCMRGTLRILALVSALAVASCAVAPQSTTQLAAESSMRPAVPGLAERLARLDAHPFFHEFVDVLRHRRDGAEVSCSLYAFYGYVVQRSGRPFDSAEFVRFRRWATDNNLFIPNPGERVVDFDGLRKRLPEFFGPSVAQSLSFDVLPSENLWWSGAAEALDSGHMVIAMLTQHRAKGEVYADADHVITLVEPVRARDGHVEAFLVSDPDSYKFWESLHRMTVVELGSKLANPKALVDANAVAIAVSTEVAYETGVRTASASSRIE